MPPDERLVQLGLMLRQRKRVRVRRTESGESCLGVGIVEFGCLVISQTSYASSPLYVGGSEAFGGQGVGVVPRYEALPSRACRQRGHTLACRPYWPPGRLISFHVLLRLRDCIRHPHLFRIHHLIRQR